MADKSQILKLLRDEESNVITAKTKKLEKEMQDISESYRELRKSLLEELFRGKKTSSKGTVFDFTDYSFNKYALSDFDKVIIENPELDKLFEEKKQATKSYYEVKEKLKKEFASLRAEIILEGVEAELLKKTKELLTY